jgi:uncharacterized lipoprotein
MPTRSRVLLTAMSLLCLAACSSSDELHSGVIPAAQAADAARSLAPQLAEDAEPDGQVFEYH